MQPLTPLLRVVPGQASSGLATRGGSRHGRHTTAGEARGREGLMRGARGRVSGRDVRHVRGGSSAQRSAYSWRMGFPSSQGPVGGTGAHQIRHSFVNSKRWCLSSCVCTHIRSPTYYTTRTVQVHGVDAQGCAIYCISTDEVTFLLTALYLPSAVTSFPGVQQLLLLVSSDSCCSSKKGGLAAPQYLSRNQTNTQAHTRARSQWAPHNEMQSYNSQNWDGRR